MTPEQVVDLLTKCAAYDQRTVGKGDVMAWWEILQRIELADALEAVRVYYTEQSGRAMPADIRKLALNIREARQARERQQERRAIEAGTRDRSEDVKALVASVVDALPKADIHQRAVDRARKERGRAVPKPYKDRRDKPKAKLPVPQSSDVATLARRYLVDGWEPKDVAEQLGVERKWCERLARRPETVAAKDKARRVLEADLHRRTEEKS